METTIEIALRTYKDATKYGMIDTPMNWHIWKRAFDTAERELKNLQLGAVSGSLPTLIEGDKFNIISGIFINPVEIVEIGLEFNVSPYIEPNVNIVAKKLWGGNDR